MREASSQVLSERAREPKGFKRTFIISLCTHIIALAIIFFGPTSWVSGEDSDSIDSVISIRLGGPDGPGEGGATPLGGRPIQEILPLDEIDRPQWIQPPTKIQPKTIMPVADRAPRLEKETELLETPDEARGRTQTRGPQLLEGTAMSDTGVSGIGVGLSTGGLGGNSDELSIGDFCCPDYLATMIELIRQRWDSKQQVPGFAVVKFSIERSGIIEDVTIDIGSGYFALDMSAQRAILLTRQLPPLPSNFMETNLIVRLTFEYRR
uniref:TonB C-terminal domain-containing protein n=1 Tax=uncultured marine thaumarchaeote AD1000_06_A03 TaxID=1455884 RepID=A0A075FMJ3_9ARCH|nr:hypothetical protein [uncultured marine thaumarchaeote AD1000_06_A03]